MVKYKVKIIEIHLAIIIYLNNGKKSDLMI